MSCGNSLRDIQIIHLPLAPRLQLAAEASITHTDYSPTLPPTALQLLGDASELAAKSNAADRASSAQHAVRPQGKARERLGL